MMKNRILSLLLTVAMLLSVVPVIGTAATTAEPNWSYSLTLQESIAINFKVAEADLADFEQIAFYKDGSLVKTVTEKPAASGGKVSFSFKNLTPSELGTKVTAKLTIGGKVYEKSLSVLDYCNVILSGYYHTTLKTIAVDLLNYGAASQGYVGEGSSLVNAGLSAYENALASADDTNLDNILSQGEAIEGATATWAGVGLNLKSSVTVRFKFAAETTEGLTMKVSCGSKNWNITSFTPAGDGQYYAYFSGLNPAQMKDTVTAVICNAEGTPVSRQLNYSVASYASIVINDTTGQYSDEVELAKAMIRYGNAVSAWQLSGRNVVPSTSVIAGGEYVITAVDTEGNELATLGNEKGDSNNICIDADASWTIRVLDETGAAYLTTPEGEYPVRGSNSSNMDIGSTETIWTIAKSGDYYTFKNKNSDNRFLACTGSLNAETGVFTPSGFKAYTASRNDRFIQFKLTPVEAEPTLESGKYNIVAKVGDTYFAVINDMHDGVTVKAQEVTLNADGTLTAPCVDAWTITTLDADGNAVVTNDKDEYLTRATSGANMGIGSTRTIWKVTKDDNGYYKLTNSGEDTRSLAYNGTGFKAYSNFSDKYPQLLLIPVAETVEHAWNSGEVVTPVSCTNNGKTLYTCTVCGDTKTETVKATGHSWTNGECANCDTILYATQVNSLDEVTTGEYMVVVNYNGTYRAMTTNYDNKMMLATDVTVASGKVQVNDACNWTVTVSDDSVTLSCIDSDGNTVYLYQPKASAADANLRSDEFSWTLTYDEGTASFRLQSSNSARYLMYNNSNGYKLYAASSTNTPTLLLFKIPG